MEIQELCKLGFSIVESQWRYRNSANSGSGVYCPVDSGDTGTLQTRVQVCIVEIQELCKGSVCRYRIQLQTAGV